VQLPVSLKDCFSVPGFASSVGLSYRAFDKDTEHSALSTILLSAGAILYVKTTTSQAQLSLDTDSNVWGRTLNPHKTTLAAGGSSGGEGALIAMKGSVLGIGTDIGGSIRVPAANCAIYGFKPTSRRVPRQGTDTWEPLGCHYTGIPAVAGPLTRFVSDIKWFFEFLEAAQPWRLDPQVFPFTMGFPAEKVRRLTIGILESNGVTNPLPPVRSMLGEAQSALCAAGHKVEVIQVKSYPTTFKIANAFMTINGSERIFDVLESVGKEPLSPWLAARMSRRPGKSLPEYYQLQHQKQEAESALLQEIWERGTGRERLDVILCPTAGHPTPKHDDWGPTDWTSPWNLVDYPIGVRLYPHVT
jgi:amidase